MSTSSSPKRICSFIFQKNFADVTKDLRQRDYPGLPRAPCDDRGPPRREAEREDATLPGALERERGAMSQGVQVSPRSRKRQGSRSPLDPPEEPIVDVVLPEP